MEFPRFWDGDLTIDCEEERRKVVPRGGEGKSFWRKGGDERQQGEESCSFATYLIGR